MSPEEVRKYWILSNIISSILILLIVLMWYIVNGTYRLTPNRLIKPQDLTKYLEIYAAYNKKVLGTPILIPTGIFIQSFHFLSPNNPVITGYLWQKYPKKALAKGVRIGYSFPESVTVTNIDQGTEKQAAYSVDYPDSRLVGWRFVGVSLYQLFDYRTYPFDKQIIWVRMWPLDFFKNIVLIPDFDAYESLAPLSTNGIESEIAIRDYDVVETYFDFYVDTLETNFGFKDFPTQLKYPDLYFNIVIKRRFLNAFILYLMPVLVIWAILFGLTMIITGEVRLAKAYHFSTTATLSALGAIFFSALLAQINLRTYFAGHPTTYIEYFYFVTYIMILLLALNAYLTTPGKLAHPLLAWGNNLLPKLLFWPIILGMINVISLYVFFIPHRSLW